MQNPISSIIVSIRPTHQTNDGKVLAISTGNGVNHAKPANREGDDASADSTLPGIAVGGVPRIQLVAAPNVVKTRLCNQVVQQRQVEVTRHREHVSHAYLHQPTGNVAAQGGIRRGDGGRRMGVAHGGNTAVGANHVSVVRLGCLKVSY
nr:hypothetical protein CR513_06800 [Ipomoea trifida]